MASKKKQKLKLVQLSSVTYNPTTFMVTLLTRKKLALNPPLVLAVNASSLRDALGRELDGNDSGQPGENFTALISKAGATVTSARPLEQVGCLSAGAVDAVLEASLLRER